ncbi:MAG TPA: peptidoglycan DD-metalloendopeptidase family protein [Thermoleophilaceae bacterium]|nr:peptidoglycan DD-metalloendopeptidase family protein [Thermoleophilaceae bacterium]
MTRLATVTLAAVLGLAAVPPPAFGAWVWPLRGEVLTSYRNGDDPYAAGQHRGIDIAGSTGAPVVAAVPGLVRFAGTAGSSGLTVSLRSADGRFDVSYLHLSAIGVRRGDSVAAGAPIGAVGTTGVRSVERPHLHFGVRMAGSRHAYVDPLALLPPPGSTAPQAPPPAPVPVPVPVAPGPAAIPEPAARRPAPHPRRLPVPDPGRSPLPQPATEPAPATVAVEESPPRAHAARRHGAVAPAPELGPAARPAASPGADRGGRSPAPGAGNGGIDVGWRLACAGLLAAALVLSGGRRAARRPRAEVRRGSASSIALRWPTT